METSTATGFTSSQAGRREWIGLAVLALPTLLASMDMTVMYLAVPAISTALKPGSAQLLWITDIYGFLEAGLLITMGTLGDRIGRRRLLLVGAVAFAIASAAAAFAASAGMLIAARALLGIAGASLLPSTLSLIRNMFHNDAQRITALGIWTTCFSAGTMLGPLVGGFLLDHFWWGSVFLMGVPVMLLFLVLGPLLLPEFRDPGAGKFDLASAALWLVASLLVIYGIKQWAEQGAGWLPLLCIAAGCIAGVLFLRRQQTLASPLIDVGLFREPAFNTTLAAMLLSLFCWSGLFLYIAQHLQLVLGMDPFKAGLWTMPGPIGSIAGCMLAPVAVRYFHRAYVMATGICIMSAGMLLLSQLNSSSSLPFLITAIALLSGGCAVTVTLCHDLVIATSPPERAGAAAGISETSATFGSALGVALLGSIGTAIYRSKMAAAVPAYLPHHLAEAARSTLGGTLVAVKQLPGTTGVPLLHTAYAAFGQSFRLAAAVCMVPAIVLAIAVAMVLRRRLAATRG